MYYLSIHNWISLAMFFTHPVYLTCMSFFLLLNTKEDIVKNVGNQIVDVW